MRSLRGAPEISLHLNDEHDHDWLDPVEDRRRLRQTSVAQVRPRDRRGHQRGWENETRAAGDEPEPPRAAEPQIDGELRGARTRDEARGAEQVEELVARQPAA